MEEKISGEEFSELYRNLGFFEKYGFVFGVIALLLFFGVAVFVFSFEQQKISELGLFSEPVLFCGQWGQPVFLHPESSESDLNVLLERDLNWSYAFNVEDGSVGLQKCEVVAKGFVFKLEEWE